MAPTKKVLPFPTPERHTTKRAQELIREIIRTGFVATGDHARQQMAARRLDMADVLSVLRGGWVAEPELENGVWRYRVQTNRQCVVVEFRSDAEIVIVTAWRF